MLLFSQSVCSSICRTEPTKYCKKIFKKHTHTNSPTTCRDSISIFFCCHNLQDCGWPVVSWAIVLVGDDGGRCYPCPLWDGVTELWQTCIHTLTVNNGPGFTRLKSPHISYHGSKVNCVALNTQPVWLVWLNLLKLFLWRDLWLISGGFFVIKCTFPGIYKGRIIVFIPPNADSNRQLLCGGIKLHSRQRLLNVLSGVVVESYHVEQLKSIVTIYIDGFPLFSVYNYEPPAVIKLAWLWLVSVCEKAIQNLPFTKSPPDSISFEPIQWIGIPQCNRGLAQVLRMAIERIFV